MDNENKLFDQIKSAAKNAENQEFPSMDKVWGRVESKLDNKVLTRQNTFWKKIAVAASVLLVASIGYQFFKDEEKQHVIPQNRIVSADTIKKITIDPVNAGDRIAGSQTLSPAVREDAPAILEEQLKNQPSVAIIDSISEYNNYSGESPDKAASETHTAAMPARVSGKWLVDRNFNSRGVTHSEAEKEDVTVTATQKPGRKEKPLYVIDGKAGTKELADSLDEEEISSLVTLPDPLYIINGVQYTETELFGPNPTSPYSPLDKQKIETISVLQDEKAVSIYGEKGKKGVVIITTKDGKPAAVKGK